MNWIDNSRYFPLMLLLPVLIFFLLWNIIPLLWMVGMSFYNYSLITGMPPRFIGLRNFFDLYDSYAVWGSLGKTFIFVFFAVGIETSSEWCWVSFSGAAPIYPAAAWR